MEDKQPFLTLDAGEQREWLVQELIEWHSQGHLPMTQATRFYRRVKLLSIRVKQPFKTTLDSLTADALLRMIESKE